MTFIWSRIAFLTVFFFNFWLQLKNKMALLCGRIVWARVQGRHRWKEKANFQPLVDYSNHGSGNGKRNPTSSRLPLDVSIHSIYMYIQFKFRFINNLVSLLPPLINSARKENFRTSEPWGIGPEGNFAARKSVVADTRAWWVLSWISRRNEQQNTEKNLKTMFFKFIFYFANSIFTVRWQ